MICLSLVTLCTDDHHPVYKRPRKSVDRIYNECREDKLMTEVRWTLILFMYYYLRQSMKREADIWMIIICLATI